MIIVSRAPAANAWTSSPLEPTAEATTYPIAAATADKPAMPTHIPMIDASLPPVARSETVAAIASGRFEMKTAARKATLTAQPTTRARVRWDATTLHGVVDRGDPGG